MKIVIEGTYTTPNAVFLDDCVRIGRKQYAYEDITDVRSVSAPARLVNGLVQLSTRSGEVLNVTYFLRDTKKMRQAMQTVMPYVRKNKEQQASTAFVETDIFGDHSTSATGTGSSKSVSRGWSPSLSAINLTRSSSCILSQGPERQQAASY